MLGNWAAPTLYRLAVSGPNHVSQSFISLFTLLPFFPLSHITYAR